jgi:predicted anti-sigma-YlaC factor YlaD
MLRCWLYRSIISRHVDDNKELPPKLQLHLHDCPACRQHFEAQTQVARRLAASAASLRKSPSPYLRSRILSSLDEPEREVSLVAKAIRPAWSGMLVGCGLVLILALIIVGGTHLLSPEPQVAMSQPSLFPSLAKLGPKLKMANSERVAEWTGVLEQPLEKEIQLMLGDAKSAAHLLADSFLPSNP